MSGLSNVDEQEEQERKCPVSKRYMYFVLMFRHAFSKSTSELYLGFYEPYLYMLRGDQNKETCITAKQISIVFFILILKLFKQRPGINIVMSSF